MKKLMIAAVAIAAGVAFADEIKSANIVGYAGNQTGASTSPMFGFTFTPVDGKDYILLETIKASNMNPDDGDIIQVINPESLGADAMYTYYSDDLAKASAKEDADSEYDPVTEPEAWQAAYDENYDAYAENIGWWDVKGQSYGMKSANKYQVTCGSGFLGLSSKKHNITFTCNGEAPTTTKAYAPGEVTSPIIANLLPTDFILSDLGVEGMNPDDGDIIQVINPESLGADAMYTYYSDDLAKASAKEDADSEYDPVTEPEAWQAAYDENYDAYAENIGWWDVKGQTYGMKSANNVAIKAAAGFLGLSDNQNSMTFKFKSVLDVTKPAAE